MKRFFSSSPLWQNTGLALVRCTFGIFLIYHGWEIFTGSVMDEYLKWDAFKNSSGKFLVYAGKAAELIAGILFVIGLFTRIASLITIGVMGYIAFFLGKGIIWYGDQHPFMFVLLAFVFFFTGPGTISLDHLLNRRK
jgi:putative oxidoreductase